VDKYKNQTPTPLSNATQEPNTPGGNRTKPKRTHNNAQQDTLRGKHNA
jgi:hypothetical protein